MNNSIFNKSNLDIGYDFCYKKLIDIKIKVVGEGVI